MELHSLNELRKRRKRLIKMLEEVPPQFRHPAENRIWELGNESARKEIADIDAELASARQAAELSNIQTRIQVEDTTAGCR